jgi:hypothetical protein
MNYVCKLEALPWDLVVVVFGQNGMCTKLGEIIKASQINVKDLSVLWTHLNPNPCIWIVVCYLP